MIKILGSTVIIIVISAFGWMEKLPDKTLVYSDEMPVREVLEILDSEITYNHEVNPNIKKASAQKGEDIIKNGFTNNRTGGNTSRISKHFVCTSCHNIERDEPDLSKIDPQSRLEFSINRGLPMVQGTALYGIVNRSSFYNDDYYKKYGDLVDAARNDLRGAIQLCATECSQGRPMKSWELESVLMYLWTLELKMNDLILSENEKSLIKDALASGNANQSVAKLISSKYLKAAPANFVIPPSESTKRKMISGNADNGALIYDHSCMHCHENRKYSFFKLDYSKLTFRNLLNNFGSYHERSIYQVARYGTQPVAGKKAYMPQYTLEKMSLSQLEDLKAYIAREAR